MQKNEREILCVFGLAGSGKTRYTRSLVRGSTRTIIIEGGFSDEDEYPGVRFTEYWDFHQYMDRNAHGLFRVRFVPLPAQFSLVCDVVRIAGGLLFVVDEADRFLVQGQLPDEWQDLVIRGRHYGEGRGVSIVVISSDPMKMPIDLRRQATRMVIFNTTEPADVKWLEDVIGKEAAAKCPMLQKFHYLEWTKGQGVVEKTLMDIGA